VNNLIGGSIGIDGRRPFDLHFIEPSRYLVEAGQAVIHDLRGDWSCARTNVGQNPFGSVQRPSHRGKLNDPGSSLEGMKSPEQAVDVVSSACPLLQCKQIGGGLLDQFARFQKKLFDEFIHRSAPHNIATYSANVSWEIGFTR
jgi:hypothetical protein